jgi:hypothetical protein
VAEGREAPPLLGAGLPALESEYRRRLAAARSIDAAGRARARAAVVRDAGGIGYDHVEGEFAGLARRLGWPAAATLKDFRHHYATGLENAGVPEHSRRYLMGHAPGRAVLASYTHLNRLEAHYATLLGGEWALLVEALEARAARLELIAGQSAGSP